MVERQAAELKGPSRGLQRAVVRFGMEQGYLRVVDQDPDHS